MPENPKLQNALDILNIIFSVLFLIECILKITGFGVAGYIKNPWNLLDFIIVSVSLNTFCKFGISRFSPLKVNVCDNPRKLFKILDNYFIV